MGIYIVRPPGRHGGVILGRLDGEFDPTKQAIAIAQRVRGVWTSRQLDVPAARLWSWDLEQARRFLVQAWAAVLVTKGFDPCNAPRDTQHIFARAQAEPQVLTAGFRDAQHADLLSGTAPSTGTPAPFFDTLYPYAWDPEADHQGRFGWKRLGAAPIKRPEATDSWSVRVGGGVQYAVLQFNGTIANASTPPPRMSSLGTLPTEQSHAKAITSTIGIQILSQQDGKLTGVVTGFDSVHLQKRKLAPDTPPHDDERLRVVVWIHGQPRRAALPEVLCQPSGYWVIEDFPRTRRKTIKFTVAVTTPDFTPGASAPGVGGDVIAVKTFPDT
jgi:hypothetical protein